MVRFKCSIFLTVQKTNKQTNKCTCLLLIYLCDRLAALSYADSPPPCGAPVQPPLPGPGVLVSCVCPKTLCNCLSSPTMQHAASRRANRFLYFEGTFTSCEIQNGQQHFWCWPRNGKPCLAIDMCKTRTSLQIINIFDFRMNGTATRAPAENTQMVDSCSRYEPDGNTRPCTNSLLPANAECVPNIVVLCIWVHMRHVSLVKVQGQKYMYIYIYIYMCM